MSKLDELIDKFCPNGVEYKEIRSISTVLRGKRLTKNQLFQEGQYPVFHGGLEPLGYYNEKNRDADTVMIINVGASAGTVGYSSVDFWSSDGCFCISHSEQFINRYLYYAILCQENYLKSRVRVAGIPTLDSAVVEKLKIPVPPLLVQSEIVRILDNFTNLASELESELTGRKKQYEYYRDKLLTFGDDIPKVKLKQICDIGDGLHGTPKYSENGCYYFINGNNLCDGHVVFSNTTKKIDFNEYSKLKIDMNNKTILMSINGTIGNIAYYNNESIALGKSVAYFKIKDKNFLKGFIYYYLQSSYATSYFDSKLTGSTIKNLGLAALRDFCIPVLPLEDQRRIVDILDRFDKLCNDISDGLPAEIEARKKQYEYYRDKLLAFKPCDCEKC